MHTFLFGHSVNDRVDITTSLQDAHAGVSTLRVLLLFRSPSLPPPTLWKAETLFSNPLIPLFLFIPSLLRNLSPTSLILGICWHPVGNPSPAFLGDHSTLQGSVNHAGIWNVLIVVEFWVSEGQTCQWHLASQTPTD